MLQEKKPQLKDWAVLLGLMLIWGSSFILIKKGLQSYSNLQVGSLRVSISFLALLPFAIGRLSRLRFNNFYLFVIAGLMGNAIPAFLFATAQTGLDSYMAGILNSLTPLFTLILGVLFWKRKTKWINVVGVIVGFAGAAGLLYTAGGGSFKLSLGPAFLVILATICYAIQMNFIKNHLNSYDAVTIASLAFIFIGFPSLFYLLGFTDFTTRLLTQPGAWAGLGYVSILSIMGTVIAIIANFWLIKRTSALFASSVTYLMPVVSIGWGLMDNEPFMITFALWIIIILGGVYMANRPFERVRNVTNTRK